MNILIVTQYFWPESFRINDMIVALRERGNSITVLTGIPNYPEGKFYKGYGIFNKRIEDYHGVRVCRVPILPRGKGGTPRLVLNYISFTLAACVLAPLLCRGKYDVIFFALSPVTEGIPAMILKEIKRVPVMFWVQDLWPDSLSATGAVRSNVILKLVEKLVRFIYRGCDRVLVGSRAFIPQIEKLGSDSSRIEYFPQTSEELYQPLTLAVNAPERAMIPTGFIVMFAGNVGAAQDFGTILKTAEILKNHTDIHWVIIGDGRMHSWVEKQVLERDLTNTVHLLGRYPVEAMPKFFSLADALLVTLKKEQIFALTIPGKVQSYLACAKPIIAALDGEGARVIKESGAGLACPSEDPDSLAQAVLSLYAKTGDERRLMGELGRRYFERNFERKMLMDKLENWMNELVNSYRKGGSEWKQRES